MAKTLAEVYGFKKTKVKRVGTKNLRNLILKEYRSILREQDEDSGEALVDVNAGPDAVLSAGAAFRHLVQLSYS